MQREIIYDTLETFLGALRENSISKIAFGETSEKRALEVEPGKLQIVHVERVDLLGYRDSAIYKCVLKDVDRDALADRLTAEGFEVTRRSRNIT
ncbi:MAG: hypothetical protein JW807_07480 [Spirochaetes bacterium]|nr:hypothetical protein [Spirochaetota bacterium]